MRPFDHLKSLKSSPPKLESRSLPMSHAGTITAATVLCATLGPEQVSVGDHIPVQDGVSSERALATRLQPVLRANPPTRVSSPCSSAYFYNDPSNYLG